MGQVAIISDIHSNYEAMTAVLDDIAQQKVDAILCLGDVIGYGANPVECLEKAVEWKFVLRGNHEEAVLNGAVGFNPAARRAIDWTRKQLKPHIFSFAATKRRWQFLADTPAQIKEGRVLYVHGSPRDPVWEYVLRSDTEDFLGGVPPKIKELLDLTDHISFFGHTHVPGIITQRSQFLDPPTVNYEFTLQPAEKYLINVGSVGQPRDGDNRACYVLFDGRVLRYRRVPYDIETASRKIRENPHLDEKLADRLTTGA
ncbi:MAG: metallophosphoesterase family protein [Planctomycetes bacterium]|nr:metallophosphoesterase family protein [Planctomycetota bacterium]